jgi:hypothetical protein
MKATLGNKEASFIQNPYPYLTLSIVYLLSRLSQHIVGKMHVQNPEIVADCAVNGVCAARSTTHANRDEQALILWRRSCTRLECIENAHEQRQVVHRAVGRNLGEWLSARSSTVSTGSSSDSSGGEDKAVRLCRVARLNYILDISENDQPLRSRVELGVDLVFQFFLGLDSGNGDISSGHVLPICVLAVGVW